MTLPEKYEVKHFYGNTFKVALYLCSPTPFQYEGQFRRKRRVFLYFSVYFKLS